MIASFELTETEIQEAIHQYISREIGVSVPSQEIKIQVKSKQNYKSEWEEAAIRAHFSAHKIGPS